MTTHLDEGLDFAPLRQLLLAHALCYLERVTLDASNDRVGVRPFLCALIQLLDDNDLLTGLASLEDDRNLTYDSASSLHFVHIASAPHFSGFVHCQMTRQHHL